MLDKTALALAIIGALNWGSIGLFGVDLVATLCGGQTAILSRITTFISNGCLTKLCRFLL